ncbi:MAG: Gfo/Idh/MocA family oxidoreductase [Acidobacteria bacterium]|nr:Gfo/Idh/MocA family oxidoreductase [Acidobacteriota bacterium]MBI3421499.1 Gfo/Idh/MocA family oxidoreductase [Acidobacteriota bacterium]
MNKLRWGVLSTSNFALTKTLPAMLKAQHLEVAAIASRDLSKAAAAAARFNIGKAYGSYEALLADPKIDVVYNPMPNHLHVPWTIKALAAGKHVLCEKPIGMSAAEAQQLLEVSQQHPRLKVMEAFMYRLHPQWQRAKQIVQAGGIGELRTIQSFFSYYNVNPANVRNQADIGGGGLMDIGCYNISLARFIFDAEPKRVLGLVEYDPTFQTDRIASGILDFGPSLGNATSTFTCSTQLAPYQRVNILGTTGRVEIEIPFNAPPDQPCKLWHQHDGQLEEISFDICDQYTLEADAFSLAVLNDTPVPTPLTDAVANMKVIEAVVLSGKSDGWVKLG